MENSTPDAEPAGVRGATGWLPRTRARLADRGKWPRSWWWPPSPEKFEFSIEDWKKQHDEISKAINKLLLVLIGFCFFCAMALGAPDRSLLASDAKIALPFANTEISFAYFLIIAPLVLAGFSFYLHIFVGYWIRLSRQRPSPAGTDTPHPELPFVFNLKYRTADWLSKFLFYWLVPMILGVFAWKDLPRPEGPILVSLTAAFIAVFLFLQLRRHSGLWYKISTILLFLGLLCSFSVAVLAFCFLLKGKPLPSRQLHLRKADLNQQDLRGLNFGSADLQEADLTGTDLTDAMLTGAKLKAANLTAANLTGSDLTGAKLKAANLAGADLTDAMLTGANLTGAKLWGANLTGADLTGAHLEGADLSEVQGLTQGQVILAKGDDETLLPPGISEPESWKKTAPATPPAPPH